jgi:hypothetical protein
LSEGSRTTSEEEEEGVVHKVKTRLSNKMGVTDSDLLMMVRKMLAVEYLDNSLIQESIESELSLYSHKLGDYGTVMTGASLIKEPHGVMKSLRLGGKGDNEKRK